MKFRNDQTLQEIGEFRIIEEIIIPLAKKYEKDSLLGDDCAFINVPKGCISVTGDVGPKPLVQSLDGYENDHEAAGWHAAVATASDIASSGAKPLCLTNCVDAPPNLPVKILISFLEGYFRACSEFGFLNAGGDVRQGDYLSSRVFGVGVLNHEYKIGRSGAKPKDHLILIGEAGRFMATYLLAKNFHKSVTQSGILSDTASKILRFPQPPLREMEILSRKGLIVAASDSSDGLLGAINNISRSSDYGFNLDLSENLLSEKVLVAAKTANCNPWNIFFCWGDWSDAVVIKDSNFKSFEVLCKKEQINWKYLGQISSNRKKMATINDGKHELNIIQNENFLEKSFNAGLKSHLDEILFSDLFQN